jgi:RNA polymerase sigma-70 factor (ECF subfamily)
LVSHEDSKIAQLLDQAAAGDDVAIQALLERHRPRLRAFVALRLDPRLQARVDPSDVIQETLVRVHQRLDDYLRERPVPFYPWLRQIALERVVDHHRRHLHAEARSVKREQPLEHWLPGRSQDKLAGMLVAGGLSPEDQSRRQEVKARVNAALTLLPDNYREVLALRFLEQLSTREAAAILQTTESAVRARQLRALDKLRRLLADQDQ